MKGKTQKGITLVALIITIIVLLILAVVAITAIQNDGIFGHANNAATKFNETQKNENKVLDSYLSFIENEQGGNKRNIQGSYIVVNDVNSKQHDLKVTLTSDTITDFSSVTLTRYGSNLIDTTKLCDENFIDNGDGTFTLLALDNGDRRTAYSELRLPAGTPFIIGAEITELDTTSTNWVWMEIVFEDDTKEYKNIFSPTTLSTQLQYSKDIVKYRLFLINNQLIEAGDYITFKNLKLNVGLTEQPYEEYVSSQSVTANANGVVEGITSVSPILTLVSDTADVLISCTYNLEKVPYNLRDKTIVNFGDSIIGAYSYPTDISSYITKLTGATVYNVGFGGCMMTTTHSIEQYNLFGMSNLATAITNGDWTAQDEAIALESWTGGKPAYFETHLNLLKSIDFNEVDIITIAYGTNDFTGSTDIDNDSNTKDTTTFAGALRYSIETIKATYPNIQIVLCTPMYRFWNDTDGSFLYDSNTYENGDGNKLTDFAQSVKDVGNEYDLFVIDNYNGCGINSTNRTECFSLYDSTHPNAVGRKMIAEYMAKKLYEQFK